MFLSDPPADAGVQALQREVEAEDGYVMNAYRLWSWRPDIHLAFTHARKLLASSTLLSAREIAVLNSTTASRLGDAYCSIAWGTKLAGLSDAPTAAAVLQAEDAPGLTRREQVLATWASAVVKDPNGTSPEDVDVLKAAGLSEREIFEATLSVAFRLAFCTVNDALGARPDRQLAQAAPSAILASVTYGRAVDDASPGDRVRTSQP